MALPHRRITVDEYLSLPLDHVTQLIDGELVVSDPTLRHQRIVKRLFIALEFCGTGEAGFGGNVLIRPVNGFIPDVWWVGEANFHRTAGDNFESPPDLVAEVLSSSTRRYDLGPKRAAYLRAGVRELWLVDPKANDVLVIRSGVEGERRLAPGDVLTTPLIPRLEIDVAAVFDVGR